MTFRLRGISTVYKRTSLAWTVIKRLQNRWTRNCQWCQIKWHHVNRPPMNIREMVVWPVRGSRFTTVGERIRSQTRNFWEKKTSPLFLYWFYHSPNSKMERWVPFESILWVEMSLTWKMHGEESNFSFSWQHCPTAMAAVEKCVWLRWQKKNGGVEKLAQIVVTNMDPSPVGGLTPCNTLSRVNQD